MVQAKAILSKAQLTGSRCAELVGAAQLARLWLCVGILQRYCLVSGLGITKPRPLADRSLAGNSLPVEYMYYLPEGRCREGRTRSSHYRQTRARQKKIGGDFLRRAGARSLASDREKIAPRGHPRPQLANREEQPHALRTPFPLWRKPRLYPRHQPRQPARD